MSNEDYCKKIGIPAGHRLVETQESEWKVKHGQDTDTYYYDHLDENGNLVAKYVIKDSTSTHPPFSRNVTWEKVA